ncbi:MAG: TylF/MycF/NovP-related O-methyltransferase [Kiloniellales bacterium]
MMRIRLVQTALKDFSLKTGLFRQTVFKTYRFMFEPHQLEFLMRCLRETKDVEGHILEIGCAYGATTVVLKKFLDHLGSTRPYTALDTFAGFLPEHTDYEIRERGKRAINRHAFSVNKKTWVAESLRQCQVAGVELVEGDATKFDYSTRAPIAFCLLDLDVYQPVSVLLPILYEHLAPGGIIVVDDCWEHFRWDGARIAYLEFAEANALAPEITCEKLGVIHRPAASSRPGRRAWRGPGEAGESRRPRPLRGQDTTTRKGAA